MPVKSNFILIFRNTVLNHAHWLQDSISRLAGRKLFQAVCGRQFQIDAHTVSQKTSFFNQQRISAGNRFHMDVTVKMVRCAQFIKGLV